MQKETTDRALDCMQEIMIQYVETQYTQQWAILRRALKEKKKSNEYNMREKTESSLENWTHTEERNPTKNKKKYEKILQKMYVSECNCTTCVLYVL